MDKSPITKVLEASLETMQDSCERAKIYIGNDHFDQEKVARVLHDLAWGFANASSSIEYAIRELEAEDAQR